MGENLDELTKQFGQDIIYNHAKSSIVVALQGFIRTRLDPERDGGPMSQDQIQAEVAGDGTEENAGWRPGMRSPGKSAAERVKEQFGKMDPELRRQLLAELAGSGAVTDTAEDEETAEEEVEQPQRAASRRNR
jgi:hypothetical protein